jgi:hypothetical protein
VNSPEYDAKKFPVTEILPDVSGLTIRWSQENGKTDRDNLRLAIMPAGIFDQNPKLKTGLWK